MIRFVDRIEGKSYLGSKFTITDLVHRRFSQYKKLGILKGVAFANNTWYIA